MQTKRCTKCKKELDLQQFHVDKSVGKPKSHCKSCVRESQRRAWPNHRRDPTTNSLYACRSNLKRKYGMTIREYEEILCRQNQRCAICGRNENGRAYKHGQPKRFCLDHNHTTGKIRGLLCSTCNRVVGIIETRSDLLERAKNYIVEHQEINYG